MNEIKWGKTFHYKKDSQGFWIAQFETDPMSATITQYELIAILQDQVIQGRKILADVGKRLDNIEQDIKTLESEL